MYRQRIVPDLWDQLWSLVDLLRGQQDVLKADDDPRTPLAPHAAHDAYESMPFENVAQPPALPL